MRSFSATLLGACTILGITACGGGDGVPVGNTPPQDSGGYQTPATTYESSSGQEPSPSSVDQAPADYSPVTGADAPSASDGSLCAELCDVVSNLACLASDSEFPTGSECLSQCLAGLATLVATPCIQEDVDLYACLFKSDTGITCDLIKAASAADSNSPDLENLRQRALAACGSQVDAVTACAGGALSPQPPPSQGGNDCTPIACNDCQDTCSLCLCVNENDQTYCSQFCQ